MTSPMDDKGVAALVYDYLKKTAGGIAENFKTKVNPVSSLELEVLTFWKTFG
jgi:hypothetical protein